jgi:hypothetical protein
MVRVLALATIVTGLTGVSALAAEEYWVARDAVSKQCEVVPKKPDGTLVIDLGKKRYPSEAEARKAMEARVDCKKK